MSKIILVYENKEFSNPIRYTLTTIFSIIGVNFEILSLTEFYKKDLTNSPLLLISYGKNNSFFSSKAKYQIHLYESNFFRKNYLKRESLPQIPLNKFENIPVVYPNFKQSNIFVRISKNKIETNLDIIASAFFMLSRYEEVVLNKKDKFGRFPATESLAYKEGFLDRPIVNEYIELLWSWIDSFNLGFERKPLWPQGKKFAACLTHDVDRVTKTKGMRNRTILVRSILRNERIKKSVKKLLRRIRRFSLNNPCWNFEQIIKNERRYGFRSSFYLMAAGNNPFDADYKINNKKIIELIQRINDKGFEVGLHGSFDSYNDYGKLKGEYDLLKEIVGEIHGIRQHYLRFDYQKTLEIQEKIGLKYDTTLGFADQEGYRSGFSLPYYPYNLKENRPFKVLEIPLTIMDRTIKGTQYRNLTVEQGWRVIRKFLEKTKATNSCVTLLWHNIILNDANFPKWGELYWKTLEWIYNNGGWGVSGREIWRWWEKRYSSLMRCRNAF